jgi:hypothetical protein
MSEHEEPNPNQEKDADEEETRVKYDKAQMNHLASLLHTKNVSRKEEKEDKGKKYLFAFQYE